MFIDQSSPATTLILLNGDLIGYLLEADTDIGYVIQLHPELGRRRLEGRVDCIGDAARDNYSILLSNYNKVREELGLETHASAPF